MLTWNMATLTLALLGPFQASLDGQPLGRLRTSKAQALLIFLATEAPVDHRREALMELLWPGLPLKSAQVNLRQTLYQVRQAIPQLAAGHGEQGVPLLLSDRQSVQLNPVADLQVDVARFQQLLSPTATPADLAQAVALYRGDFLCDFYLPDSAEFEDWAASRRAEYRRQALEAFDALIAFHAEQGRYDRAQSNAWRALEIDGLRESVYRGLMTALALDGQRPAALALYQRCRKHLRRELGVEPSAETHAVYEQIQADALHESQERGPRPAPVRQGMPVFLFTDIEGSTPLWETHREAMLPALLAHNRILEEQIVAHGGRILELRGDGVKAVFEGVDPLPCVLAIQRAFAQQDWGVIGQIRIRVGLHGVPPQLEGDGYFLEGDQYYGPALHHAARIMGAGHGGQILVSEEVRNAFPLPPGASWHDFGAHALKGVEEPQRIFGLGHPDLPIQAFPPLRTLTTQAKEAKPARPLEPAKPRGPKHNLPPQHTPFIGREQELADLEQLIADPGTRLITIVGPGGIGKTRLALALAARQVQAVGEGACRFPDGIFLVPLAELRSADQIVPAIADAVAFRFGSGDRESRTPEQQILDYLREKRMLLVLDNIEHLLLPLHGAVRPAERSGDGRDERGGITVFTDILTTAPHLKLLATSRERLLLHEEQVYPIQGLQHPDWERPDDTAEYAAARLFLGAARRVLPGFEVPASDLTYLARICRLLEGMPLAIELAAGWVDVLSLAGIAAEIQHGLHFLATEWRDVPARHRSMRAAFDGSWCCLSESEQQVLAQLSVFRGGFTRTGAREVAGADLRTLARLVDRSLLQFRQDRERYQLHELLRQYGTEKLAQDPADEAAARDRHSAFFCAALEAWEVQLKGPRTPLAVAEIEADLANVATAWHWAATHGQALRLEQGMEALRLFCFWGRRFAEGEAAFKLAVDGLEGTQGTQRAGIVGAVSDGMPRVLVRAKLNRSTFNFQMGHLETARTLLRECETLLDSMALAGQDTRSERARLHWMLAWAAEPDWNQSCWHLEQSVALYRDLKDHWMMASVLFYLSSINAMQGAVSQAWETLEECLRLFRTVGFRSGTVDALNLSGRLTRATGDYEAAQRKYKEALALARAQSNPAGTATCLDHLGWLALFLGDFQAAADYLQESAAVYREAGFRPELTVALVQSSVAHWFSGEFDHAYAGLEEARAIAEKGESRWASQHVDLFHAWLDTAAGRYESARTILQRRLELSRQETLFGFWAVLAHGVSGWVALAEGDCGEARRALCKAVAALKESGEMEREYTPWSLAPLGRAEFGLRNAGAARAHLLEALEIVVEIRAFIPLLHLMPVIPVILADEEDFGLKERAVELYAMARGHPFVAKAVLFEDVAGRYVRAATADLAPEVVAAAQARGRALDWWETAEALLVELTDLGWGS